MSYRLEGHCWERTICIFRSEDGALAASLKASTLSSNAKVRVIGGFTSMAPEANIATQRGNTWAFRKMLSTLASRTLLLRYRN
jgi:hypothetical protein